jgi:hypothetical protein
MLVQGECDVNEPAARASGVVQFHAPGDDRRNRRITDMLIEIEFPIVTTGTPIRSAKSKTVVFKDSIKVDIPTFSREESSVALTVPSWPASPEQASYFGVDGDLFVSTSFAVPANGVIPHTINVNPTASVLTADMDKALVHLGETLRKDRYSAISTALHPPELAQLFEKGLTPSRTGVLRQQPTISLRTLNDIGVAEIDMGDVESQRSKFRDHMGSFIIVDGVFKQRVPEPLYAVDIGMENATPTVRIVLPVPGKRLRNHSWSTAMMAYFAGDKLEEAVAYAENLKRVQIGRTITPKIPEHPIQVNDSSYLKCNDESESLTAVADMMLLIGVQNLFPDAVASDTPLQRARQHRRMLEAASTDALGAWKSLQASLESGDADELPEAMQRCLKIIDGHGECVFTSSRLPSAVVDVALAKWEGREVALKIDARSGPHAWQSMTA